MHTAHLLTIVEVGYESCRGVSPGVCDQRVFVDTVDMKIKAHNAFNAMFVDTVDTGVCGSYTIPYTEYYAV